MLSEWFIWHVFSLQWQSSRGGGIACQKIRMWILLRCLFAMLVHSFRAWIASAAQSHCGWLPCLQILSSRRKWRTGTFEFPRRSSNASADAWKTLPTRWIGKTAGWSSQIFCVSAPIKPSKRIDMRQWPSVTVSTDSSLKFWRHGHWVLWKHRAGMWKVFWSSVPFHSSIVAGANISLWWETTIGLKLIEHWGCSKISKNTWEPIITRPCLKVLGSGRPGTSCKAWEVWCESPAWCFPRLSAGFRGCGVFRGFL